jgi:hypothetical protein
VIEREREEAIRTNSLHLGSKKMVAHRAILGINDLQTSLEIGLPTPRRYIMISADRHRS